MEGEGVTIYCSGKWLNPPKKKSIRPGPMDGEESLGELLEDITTYRIVFYILEEDCILRTTRVRIT